MNKRQLEEALKKAVEETRAFEEAHVDDFDTHLEWWRLVGIEYALWNRVHTKKSRHHV